MKTSAEIALFVIKYNNLSAARAHINKRGRFARNLMKLFGLSLRERFILVSTKKRKMSVTFIIAEILGGIYVGRVLTSRL